MADPGANHPLVQQLLALLKGNQAHAPLEAAVAEMPAELLGVVPPSLPYSAWQLLEHLRIAQRDILEFSAPPPGGYTPREWPAAYWPKDAAPPSPGSWNASLDAIQSDREAFEALLTASDADLYAPFPWGEGQNLLREALLLADHNSYHTAELIVLRRLLGVWPV